MTTPIQSFLFDPEKGETPEGVARKRKIADLLAQRIGAPKNVGEGLSAAGAAIGAILQSRRAAAGEEAGRAGLPSETDLWADLEKEFGGGTSVTPAVPPITIGSAGSSGYPAPAPPPSAPPAAPTAGPVFSAAPSQPPGAGGSGTPLSSYLYPGSSPSNLNIDPAFMPRLAKFLAEAPDGGIKIKSGFRDVATQAQLFAAAVKKYGSEAAARKWVAPPGASQHNKGNAVDLAYATPAQKKWAHENAAAYGLTFPMSWEDWHIQPDPNWKGAPQMAGGAPPSAGRPVQVASLDPSIGLPPLPTPRPPYPVGGAGLPPGAATEPAMPPGTSPGVGAVASALLPGSVGPSDGAPSMLQPPGAPPAGGPPMAPGAVTSRAMGAMPPPAPTRVASAMPPTGPLSSTAMKYMSSGWATPQQQAIAKIILENQLKQRDPATRLALEKAQIDLENARNPAGEIKQDPNTGDWLSINPRTGAVTLIQKGAKTPERMTVDDVGYERQPDGSWKAVTPARGPDWRDATPEEVAAMSLPPNTPLQVNTRTGQKQIMSGASGLLSGTVDQDIVSSLADGVANGTIPPDMKSYYKYKVPVMAELQSRGTNLSELTTDWAATQRHFATLNNPQQTRIRQNIDTLQHTLPTIRQLAGEWNAGGYPLLNRATREAALQGALGPDANRIVTLLGQQVADVVGEISSVLMGGNSPTDHAMELAAQNLSADWSYPTIIAALDQLDRNITFRRNAIENVSTAGVTDSKYQYGQGGGTPAPAPAPAPPPGGTATSPAPGAPTPGPFFGTPSSAAPAPPSGDRPSQSYLDSGGTEAGWKLLPPDKRKLFP